MGKTLLSVKEAASELGVSRSSVYGLVKAGALRAFRVGLGRGTIRIEVDDLGSVRKPPRPREDEEESPMAAASAAGAFDPCRTRIAGGIESRFEITELSQGDTHA